MRFEKCDVVSGRPRLAEPNYVVTAGGAAGNCADDSGIPFRNPAQAEHSKHTTITRTSEQQIVIPMQGE